MERKNDKKEAINLDQLVANAHQTAKEKGWWEDKRSALDCHMLMVSEIAEATESYRNMEVPVWTTPEGKPCGEAIELADCVIRIADYFGKKGWSLDDAVRLKLHYNISRPFRHGGKVA